MEITKVSDLTFKIKGKTGFALASPTELTIESIDGSNTKNFKTAGEYEVAGISVIGIKTEEGTVFVYEVDGLRICHMGNITKKLSDSKASAVGDIDVLLLPVNSQSIEILQQIESYFVVPFGYKDNDELDKFLKESGFTVEKMPKFALKKDDIVEDQTTEIIVLDK